MITCFDEKDKTLLLIAIDLAIVKMRADGVSCYSWQHFEALEAKVRAYDCAAALEAEKTYGEFISYIGDMVDEAARDERQIDLEEAIANAVARGASVSDVPTDAYPNADYPCDVEPADPSDPHFIDIVFSRRAR